MRLLALLIASSILGPLAVVALFTSSTPAWLAASVAVLALAIGGTTLVAQHFIEAVAVAFGVRVTVHLTPTNAFESVKLPGVVHW